MKQVKRVLVPCSFSGNWNALVHFAGSVARAMNAELYILSVIHNPFGVEGLSFPRPSLKQDFAELVEKTRAGLQELVREEHLQGVVAHDLIREGKPVREIVNAVREKYIDLLVLPAHEQTWLENLVAGRENEALFRKMPCSILFFKLEPETVAEEEDEQEESEGMEAA